MKQSLLTQTLPSPKSPKMGETRSRAPQKMELVHLNKREIANFDKAQGGSVMKHGVKDYSRLGHIFNNPDFSSKFEQLGRSFHAKGGVTKLKEMRKHGRNGDTEVALMPSHVCDRLDRMIGGTCINPKSKKREYFLGALASGIANIASKAAPYAAKAASFASKAAPYVGKAANFAMNAAPTVMAIKQAYDSGKNQPPQMDENGQPITMGNTAMNSGMDAMMKMLQAKQGGAGWGDALQQGAGTAMNSFQNSQYAQNARDNYDPNAGGPSKFGQMAQQFSPLINAGKSAYGAYKQGGNMQDALMQGGYTGAMEGLGRMGGQNSQMAQNMLKSGYGAYQGGQGMGGAVREAGMSGAMQGLDRMGGQNARSAQNMLQQGYQGYQNGGMQGAMRGAGRAGIQEGLGRMSGPSGQAARDAYNAYDETGDMGQAALRGAGSYAQGRGYQDLGQGFNSAAQARGQGGGLGNMAGMGALGAMQSYQSRRQPQYQPDYGYDDSMDEYGY